MQFVWFRRDLRTLDNVALANALQLNRLNTNQPVVGIYIATPSQWSLQHQSAAQTDLIMRRLLELNRQLQSLGIPLLYTVKPNYSAAAQEVVRIVSMMAGQKKDTAIHFSRDYEFYERERDTLVTNLLSEKQIPCYQYHDKTLLPPGAVLNKSGEMFKVFTPFKIMVAGSGVLLQGLMVSLTSGFLIRLHKVKSSIRKVVLSVDGFLSWRTCLGTISSSQIPITLHCFVFNLTHILDSDRLVILQFFR